MAWPRLGHLTFVHGTGTPDGLNAHSEHETLGGEVVRLCVEAHREPNFVDLFSYLPDEGLHKLAWDHAVLVGHAVITTRWLQGADGTLRRTAYFDAASTRPGHQRSGVGTAVVKEVATLAAGWEIACLETERTSCYERLGWNELRGPLACRAAEGLVPTPEQTGITILRLPNTRSIQCDELLTVEAGQRIW